ncbi:MAG: bifunctional nuclease family protein [Halobacteriales archaeon]|nr:bifunctional nuclease family protein [Halobacteriales archaeon]
MTAPPAQAKDTVPVSIENVLMSSQGPVVLLAPGNGGFQGRVLPIFIDHAQALNIQIALEGELSPRPMTHDLFSTVLNELGAIVEKVVIEELAQNTFYASLYIEIERNGKKDTKRFDARPSDCLALAVRVNARIEVRRSVMDQASIKRTDLVKGEGEGDELQKPDFDPDADLGVSL